MLGYMSINTSGGNYFLMPSLPGLKTSHKHAPVLMSVVDRAYLLGYIVFLNPEIVSESFSAQCFRHSLMMYVSGPMRWNIFVIPTIIQTLLIYRGQDWNSKWWCDLLKVKQISSQAVTTTKDTHCFYSLDQVLWKRESFQARRCFLTELSALLFR